MKHNSNFPVRDFNRIVEMIKVAQIRAYAKVNEELINLYFNVGKFVSEKVQAAEWGTGVVDQLAQFIKENHPEIKGFTRRGLYRMKQFYETYKDSEIVSALRTQFQNPCTSRKTASSGTVRAG